MKNKNLITLVVLYGAAFVAAFNENAVNVALVDIMAEFMVDSVTAQWLVTGYMIVTSVVVALSAFLSQRFALKTLFGAASFFLVCGCILAMFATSFPALMALRLFQACGTGLFIPLMMTSVLTLAPRPRIGRFMAIGSCCITLGPAFGPVVSGLMVTLLGWRFVFLPTAVIVAILAVAALCLFEKGQGNKALKVDALSVVFVVLALTLVSYGLTLVMSDVLSCVGFAAAGLFFLVAFGFKQTRLESPILNIKPLKSARFCACCLLAMFSMMTTFSMSVLLPLYFQSALGASALFAGILILVPIVINAITSLCAGKILDAYGEFPLLPLGFACIVVGQVATWILAVDANAIAVVISASVTYAGVGLVFSPSQTVGLQGLSHEMAPHGVSIINLFIQVAACLGPALYVGLMAGGAANAFTAGATYEMAQAVGFSNAVLVAAFVGLVGVALSLGVCFAGRKANKKSEAVVAVDPLQSLMKTDVYSLTDKQTLLDAMRLFREKGISAAPVLNAKGALVGIVSDGDIMRCLSKQVPALNNAIFFVAEQESGNFNINLRRAVSISLGDICTRRVISVNIEDDLPTVAHVLSENHLKKAPVLQDGKMVGVINRSNITRYAIDHYLELCK